MSLLSDDLCRSCLWSDKELTFENAIRTQTLPTILRIKSGQYGCVGTLKRQLNTVYVHSYHSSQVVIAEGQLPNTGNNSKQVSVYAIPISYKGFFEILTEDKKSNKTIVNACDLKKCPSKHVLIREVCKAFVTNSSDETISKNKTRNLQVGEILTCCEEHKSITGSMKSLKDKEFIKLKDQQNKYVWFEGDQKVYVSPISEASEIIGVHSLTSIINNFSFPLMVQLAYGDYMSSFKYHPIFRLMGRSEIESAVCIPLKSNNQITNIPISEMLKVNCLINPKDVSNNEEFRSCVKSATTSEKNARDTIFIITFGHIKLLKKSKNSISSPSNEKEEIHQLYEEVDEIYRYIRDGGMLPDPKQKLFDNTTKSKSIFSIKSKKSEIRNENLTNVKLGEIANLDDNIANTREIWDEPIYADISKIKLKKLTSKKNVKDEFKDSQLVNIGTDQEQNINQKEKLKARNNIYSLKNKNMSKYFHINNNAKNKSIKIDEYTKDDQINSNKNVETKIPEKNKFNKNPSKLELTNFERLVEIKNNSISKLKAEKLENKLVVIENTSTDVKELKRIFDKKSDPNEKIANIKRNTLIPEDANRKSVKDDAPKISSDKNGFLIFSSNTAPNIDNNKLSNVDGSVNKTSEKHLPNNSDEGEINTKLFDPSTILKKNNIENNDSHLNISPQNVWEVKEVSDENTDPNKTSVQISYTGNLERMDKMVNNESSEKLSTISLTPHIKDEQVGSIHIQYTSRYRTEFDGASTSANEDIIHDNDNNISITNEDIHHDFKESINGSGNVFETNFVKNEVNPKSSKYVVSSISSDATRNNSSIFKSEENNIAMSNAGYQPIQQNVNWESNRNNINETSDSFIRPNDFGFYNNNDTFKNDATLSLPIDSVDNSFTDQQQLDNRSIIMINDTNKNNHWILNSNLNLANQHAKSNLNSSNVKNDVANDSASNANFQKQTIRILNNGNTNDYNFDGGTIKKPPSDYRGSNFETNNFNHNQGMEENNAIIRNNPNNSYNQYNDSIVSNYVGVTTIKVNKESNKGQSNVNYCYKNDLNSNYTGSSIANGNYNVNQFPNSSQNSTYGNTQVYIKPTQIQITKTSTNFLAGNMNRATMFGQNTFHRNGTMNTFNLSTGFLIK